MDKLMLTRQALLRTYETTVDDLPPHLARSYASLLSGMEQLEKGFVAIFLKMRNEYERGNLNNKEKRAIETCIHGVNKSIAEEVSSDASP